MKPIGTITIPVYELPERSYTGFRQHMLEAGPHSVSTGAGLGTDSIWAELETDGEMKYYHVQGRDVLAAVAKLTNHPEAPRLPVTEGMKDA